MTSKHFEYFGISRDLDNTLMLLASTSDELDRLELLELVEKQKERIEFWQRVHKHTLLRFLNSGLTKEELFNAKLSVQKSFALDNTVYWYENTLTDEVLENQKPAIRVATITELIKQAETRWPDWKPSERWKEILANEGLLEAELNTDDLDLEENVNSNNED